MKKTFTIALFALVAALALLSCNKSELDEQKTFANDKAFMTVVINDAGVTAATKSTLADDGFEYDSGISIASANFYFYDADGNYETKASDTNIEVSSSVSGGVEGTTEAVVVLQDLAYITYPKYMVTVINKTDNFVEPKTGDTLEEILSVLSDPESTDGGIYDASDNFVMSTTSYDSGSTYYYVSEVSEENFATEDTELEDAVPVQIYVERLAVKVVVKFPEDALDNKTDSGLYEISFPECTYEDGEMEVEENSSFYVKVYGWRLNATAKHSYIVKNIKTSWAEEYLGFEWNDAENHRSYWGMSYNYGKGTTSSYPSKWSEIDKENDYLNYVSLGDVGSDDGITSFGEAAYCAENTNTAGTEGIIVSANSAAITSVLIKAQLCTVNGTMIGNYVLYEGMLWQKDEFLEHLVDSWGFSECTVTTGDDDDDVEIYDCLELGTWGDGEVYPQLTDEAEDYTFMLDDTDVTSKLKDAISDFKTNFDAHPVISFHKGLMYYNIPIQHLNVTLNRDDNGTIIPAEGNYGVVRNHSYYITIGSITTIGRGIHDPDEEIIPNEDLDNYYLSATVSVLPWKVVENTVDL
ncbi:MAG: Mfa1 family fimbria major subunit [Porphyromonadaceae bacterium]|nr:Mfa1 family fimbria major subunit [Porphyromonadaceae bacterium]